ncbi:MAG: RNA methyltransferase [Polyangiaceae bacterium]|nr:RNA methyltransferase [Polyangiaceae bacterium]
MTFRPGRRPFRPARPPADEPEEEGRVVFGIQPVREVLRAKGDKTSKLLLADGDNPKLDGLERLAASRGLTATRVPRAELDRRTKGGMHQGAFAVAPVLEVLNEEQILTRLEAEANPVVMILDGIMDPQNFGAVVRGAVALGAFFVVWPEHGSAPLTPATFRASAGAVEHAILGRVRALPGFMDALASRGFTSVLLDGNCETALDELDLTGPVAIVVGAEDVGAKPSVRRAATRRARIPMSGTIDSLNASVASALALYETMRQRRVGSR